MTARNAAICQWTICTGIVLFGVLLVVSFRAIVPLAAILTILLLIFGPREALWGALRRAPTTWALLAFWCVGALSAMWTINPDQTVPKIFQLAAIFCAGATLILLFSLSHHFIEFKNIRSSIIISFSLCVILILIGAFLQPELIKLGTPDYFFYGTASILNRSTILAAIILFVTLLSVRNPIGALIVASVASYLFYVIAFSDNTRIVAPLFAFSAGLIFALLAFGAPALARRATPLFAASLFLAAPLLTAMLGTPLYDFVATGEANAALGSASGAHRLEIWLATVERIADRPLLGWGLDVARNVPAPPNAVGEYIGPLISFHTHNAPLQIWLELGALGAVAAAALIYTTLRAIFAECRTRVDTALVMGAVFSALAIACISFGALQSWWIVSLILLIAIGGLVLRLQPGR